MVYIGEPTQPSHLVLDTRELYDKYQRELFLFVGYVGNDLDIKEIFNQAIDYITDDTTLFLPHQVVLNTDMLRCKGIKGDTLFSLNSIFQNLCRELRIALIDLHARPIIDMTTMCEIYPYYFVNLIRGSIVLKRF